MSSESLTVMIKIYAIEILEITELGSPGLVVTQGRAILLLLFYSHNIKFKRT